MNTDVKKSSIKKYKIGDFLRAIKRNFLIFFSIVIVGINVGISLYFFVPQAKYVSVCNINYSGSKLDEFQQSRISDLITSNESVDKYVMSLAASNVKNGDNPFTFTEISSNVSCSILSVSPDSKNVVFAIRFSFGNPDIGIPVLKVISSRAVKELNAIYTKDSFGVVNNSFTNESIYKIRDTSLLLLPIALSIIVSVVAVVIIDLRTDIVFDVNDCDEFFGDSTILKPSKDGKYDANCIVGNVLIVCDNDIKHIKDFASEFLPKNIKIQSFTEYSNKKSRKDDTQKMLVVVLGLTKFSDFASTVNAIKSTDDINKYKSVCVVLKKGKNRSGSDKNTK